IHWFIYTDPETGVKYSGDSFVPYYIAEINAAMSGEQLTLIPEPGTWAMLIAAAVACMLYARRSGWPRFYPQ
ncbi:MAG: PEP-CTERM sorting domain-containing protein, partial [Pirellulales bacterium]|nr:PEP-CTERM sorting domain-containing protein [Pirellulales bacterium]